MKSYFDVSPTFAQQVADRHRAGKPFSSREILAMNDQEYRHMIGHAAMMQRGDPENLMVHMQRLIGGGVMSFAIEHVGDLFHRAGEPYAMTHFHRQPPEALLEKLPKTLKTLTSGYGFEREHRENVASNRRFFESLGEHYPTDDQIKQLGRLYSELHGRLFPYTLALEEANRAARKLGMMLPFSAADSIERLQQMSSSPENWHNAMSQSAAVEHVRNRHVA